MINEDALRSIEKLHEMKAAGILSEEEFAAAKQDLLQGKAKRPAGSTAAPQPAGEPTLEDHLQWMLLPIRRYAQFEGRSGRKEFWMFQLLIILAAMVLFTIASLGTWAAILAAMIGGVGLVGTIIPCIAVQVRRFHDQGKSGWFVLFNLIPYLGSLVVLIFMALPGTEGENEYGPDPRL